MTLGLIRVGNLKTYVELVFNDTDTSDINHVLDISGSTSKKITFIDPDGTSLGPFDLTFVNTGGDGRAYYYTDSSNSLWTKAGIWRWYGTATLSSGEKISTNDVVREVLE